MVQEWRSTLRTLVRRRRGLSAAIVLTLALGIGANSAIFSAIDAVLLKPLPYPAADRLVVVHETNTARKGITSRVAPGRLEEWNRESRTLEGLAGTSFENVTDTSGALPERVEAMRTSPRFFEVLKTPAALGRTLTREEEAFGGPKAVVLSDGFWRTRFNGDPHVVGRRIVLGGEARTIVGVMPPSFRFPTARTEVWFPAQMPSGLLGMRDLRILDTVGRLKPGVTVEEAQADLAAVQARLAEQFPDTDRGWSATVAPLKEERVGGVRRSLWTLFGAVLLVLLATCANVACLLLADATRREHDVAVRFALGADRGRIVRQLLREGTVLAVAGAGLGLLLARWGIQVLRSTAAGLPRAEELAIDVRLVAFTLVLGVGTTMLFALAPALQATRREVAVRLAGGGGSRGAISGRHPVQRVLVAAQVTLAIVLLVGAGLLVRSFSRLQQVAPGFDPDSVLAFRMSGAWSESMKPEVVAARQVRTLERLAAIPGVTDVGMATVLPATKDLPPAELKIAGRDSGERVFAVARRVSSGYFRTLRIPVVEGATCQDDPRPEAPREIVVNRSFAARFFPGEDPIGHSIVHQRVPGRIVGVAADAREQGLMKDPEPITYTCGLMPYPPDPFFVVRTDPSRPVGMGVLRSAMQEIEPGRAVYAAATLRDAMGEALSQPRLNTLLLGAFASTALLLAAIGLYGMLAQFVAQRRREIGVRMALGARPADVLRQVLAHAGSVVGVGLLAGLACAFGVSRLLGSLVWGIPTHDPVTFVSVPVVLAAIAAAAAVLPARRAVRVNPVQALRDE